jgi:hypothetical protein
MSQRLGLAAAGTSQYQKRPLRNFYGPALFRIQILKQMVGANTFNYTLRHTLIVTEALRCLAACSAGLNGAQQGFDVIAVGHGRVLDPQNRHVDSFQILGVNIA